MEDMGPTGSVAGTPDGTERLENLAGDPQSPLRIERLAFGGSAEQEGVVLTTLDRAVNWVR